MGRPSKFTQGLADQICDRLALGEPMAVICRDEGYPSDRTVRDWISANEEFSAAIARARESGYDMLAAQCLEIADTPLLGQETVTKAEGQTEVREGDMLGHRKLQIDTRMKLLSKWDPKRFGDKLALGQADDLAPLTVVINKPG
jgi:hypothetical protein